jgi:serine/threonine protein kinase
MTTSYGPHDSIYILETWRNRQRSHLSVRAFKGYAAYVGTLPLDARKTYSIGQQPDTSHLAELLPKLRRVVNEHMYPTFCQGMTQFQEVPGGSDLESDYYFKGPNLSGYAGNNEIAQAVLAEAKTNERLMKHPHPNLAVYVGCVVHDGLIVRLVFRRYLKILSDHVAQATRPSDFSLQERNECMDSIEAGVAHLHEQDLAHNDISPENIMFDHNNVPILIDLDSCAPIGTKIAKGGHVTGWRGPLFDNGPIFNVSSVECDKLAV